MMSVQEQINSDIKDAMKAKNVDKLAALRAVKSAIMLEATKEGIPEVSDDISLKLIAKLVKQRKDSAAIFTEQNRPDLAVDEVNQLAYLEPYLPVQMLEEEVRKVEEIGKADGWEKLHSTLMKIDPFQASKIGKRDSQRITRQLSVWKYTWRTLRSWQN